MLGETWQEFFAREEISQALPLANASPKQVQQWDTREKAAADTPSIGLGWYCLFIYIYFSLLLQESHSVAHAHTQSHLPHDRSQSPTCCLFSIYPSRLISFTLPSLDVPLRHTLSFPIVPLDSLVFHHESHSATQPSRSFNTPYRFPHDT